MGQSPNRNPTKSCTISKIHGFTLVELLCTLGIISLILAFAIPAVQSARESARRMSCANNMRQIALACIGYEANLARFPDLMGLPPRRILSQSMASYQMQYSVFAQILPQIEQSSLFDSINFSMGAKDPYWSGQANGSEANTTASSITLNILLCPSCSGSLTGNTGPTNYRANSGTERWNGHDNTNNMLGPFGGSLASVTDGLSNTALFSEKLIGSTSVTSADARALIVPCGRGVPYTVDEFIQACSAEPFDILQAYGSTGLTWMIGTLPQTTYNHIVTPNSKIMDFGFPLLWLFDRKKQPPGRCQHGSGRRVYSICAR